MTVTVSRTFPGLTPRELVEGQTSDEYLRDRSAALGGTDPATVTRDGGTVVVTFPRRMPVESFPSFARPFAGDGKVTQYETWTEIGDERCAATMRTESRLPGTVTGTYEVTRAGDGATFTVTATAKVDVPFVGGKLAKEAEEQVRKLVEAEMDFAEQWLASR